MDDTKSVYKNNICEGQGWEGCLGDEKDQEGREIEVLSASALVVCQRMRDCPPRALAE